MANSKLGGDTILFWEETMTEKTKNEIGHFIFFAILWTLIVMFVLHELDKDVEKNCGSKRHANAPAFCNEYWDSLDGE